MNRYIFILLVSALPLFSGLSSLAAGKNDSLSVQVYFKQNVTKIGPEFRGNKALLDRFVTDVKDIISDTACTIQDIHIRSGASPEGRFDHNKELSRKRALALKYYLKKELDLPNDKFLVESVGEDWAALQKMVEKSDAPDREDILDILDRHSGYINGCPTSSVGGPKRDLMELHGGKTWFWLLEHIFPDLRSAGNSIVCRYTRIGKESVKTHSPDTMVIIHKYVFEIDTISRAGSVRVLPQAKDSSRNQLSGPGYRIDIEADMQVDGLTTGNHILDKEAKLIFN